MIRSLGKRPFVAYHLLEKLEYFIKNENSMQVIMTWSRSSTVVPIMIGYTIFVYNGHEHLPIFVTDQIVGHKLGEFALTRTFRSHMKSSKKIKRLYFFFIFMFMEKKSILLVFYYVFKIY